jgi:hypothetical protein
VRLPLEDEERDLERGREVDGRELGPGCVDERQAPAREGVAQLAVPPHAEAYDPSSFR